MFLNSWSLALSLGSILVLFLGVAAARTAVRVLRHWNPASDDNHQIRLENEIWLASTLVKYTLGFQILSLILFVLAADQFCQVIVGAMCATGALLANGFGMPALGVKLAGVFFYGFWIVLHQLDISAETYPLVRAKYIYLLILLPLLVADLALQTFYIDGLKPDIITSCCAVVFGETKATGQNLISGISKGPLLLLYYGTITLLLAAGITLNRHWRRAAAYVNAGLWLFFFGLALVVITTVLSSYIYAMPFHRCPFCILKPEYHAIGFAIYGTLIAGTFCGIAAAAVEPFRCKPELTVDIARFQKLSNRVALFMLVSFTALSSYHALRYLITGGEG
ncbi:MAG: hypothetical protein A2521_09205 [Deltaproteobacteria bacterium RIFOXYD12_FULL_57_12]|nr:MAG: hypothetical protein A2521_09205 [Deltaproteobacteria bacterium RIFOXYD12_FULL_57_12]